MTGKENFFWIFYGLVLLGLFLLSSTDLIIKEEEAGIYPISVIVGDTTDDQYVNFRKGMERAAIELNGDVSFITLYEKGSARQQREMILREQEDGSQALIVDPVEEGMIAQIRQESRASWKCTDRNIPGELHSGRNFGLLDIEGSSNPIYIQVKDFVTIHGPRGRSL